MNELLCEGPAEATSRPPVLAARAVLPVVEVARTPESVPAVEARLAEADEQRQQLQRLLQSARIQVEQLEETAVVAARPTITEPEPESEPPFAEPATAADIEVLQGLLEWNENGRPEWAQQSFEALLFTVSGLTLAVPLISLGQIQPLTDELTPLFGQADWFMGLQPTPAGKVRTVNTAKFVMPERYDPAFVETARYVVSINGVPWGLAVDTVEQPITLDPEDVKWRSARTQRPWLAGTVKAHMCALLDIPMMGKLLVDSDRNVARA